MIKAITFDLDGVYFINGKSNFIAALAGRGVPKEEAERVFLKSEEMNELYKTGRMTDQEFWSFAVKEWRLKMSVEEIIGMLVGGYEVNREVADIVRKIRQSGYKTCVCSNNFPARINGLNAKFGFLKDFDVVALSYEVGAVKPSSAIFLDLIAKSGVKPEEILFADDDEENPAAAGKLGIQAFFYRGFSQFLEKLQESGVYWK